MLQTRHGSFSGIPHIRMRSASGTRDAGVMHHTGQRKRGQLATDVALCYAQMLATRFMRYDAQAQCAGHFSMTPRECGALPIKSAKDRALFNGCAGVRGAATWLLQA